MVESLVGQIVIQAEIYTGKTCPFKHPESFRRVLILHRILCLYANLKHPLYSLQPVKIKCGHILVIEKLNMVDSHIPQLFLDLPVINIADKDSAGFRKAL